MSALRLALSEYVDEVTAGASPPPGSSGPTAGLQSRLRQIQSTNAIYFIAAAGMLAVTFLAAMGLIVSNAIGSSGSIAVASGFGISVVGMTRLMLALWREKVATAMLIELSELDDGVMKKVVAKLLRRMR